VQKQQDRHVPGGRGLEVITACALLLTWAACMEEVHSSRGGGGSVFREDEVSPRYAGGIG
jgi:hypothetical protein